MQHTDTTHNQKQKHIQQMQQQRHTTHIKTIYIYIYIHTRAHINTQHKSLTSSPATRQAKQHIAAHASTELAYTRSVRGFHRFQLKRMEISHYSNITWKCGKSTDEHMSE